MEYAEGGSLSDYINQLRDEYEKSKDITATANRAHINFIVKKFIELGNALEHIHSKGFIHRDIKPHNILLSGESKQFKFTDFGIAHAEDMTRMTKAGDFFGTIHYMSPEQITAHRTTVDRRTDIYSLGVSLYEALTLSLPFKGVSEEELIGEIIAGHYIPARKRSKIIPKDLETILIKSTHHDPKRRYQSASEFAGDLKRFIEDRPIKARRDSLLYKASKNLSLKRRTTQLSLVLIFLLILSGLIITNVQQERFDKEKIVTTLKRAVITKTSPFEFELEWSRLSQNLYSHIHIGKVDSLMIWFLKSTSVPQYDFEKYTLFDESDISVSTLSLVLFDSAITHGDEFLITKSYCDIKDKYGNLVPIGVSIETYSPPALSSYNPIDLMRDVKDSVAGEKAIEIRMINEYYINCKLHEKLKFFKNRTKFESSLENRSYIIDLNGDTLIHIPGVSMSINPEFLQDEFYAILDNRLRQVQPLFVDTIIDTIQFFAWEYFASDYITRVFDSALADSVYNTTRIQNITIVKKLSDSNKNEEYEILLRGFFGKHDYILPIAGLFQIKSDRLSEPLIKGKIRRGGGRFEMIFDYPLIIESRGFNGYQNVAKRFIAERFLRSSTENRFRSSSIAVDPSAFTRISGLGEVDAILEITPNTDVAAEVNYISKIWGYPLKYNIKFQAIDSTNLN